MARHVFTHSLDDAGAHALIDEAFAHYAGRYPAANLQLNWQSQSHAELHGVARGLKLRAKIELQVGHCLLDVDVPFLLRPFQDVAQRAIEREVKRWLERGPKTAS
jgi:hypothetical protein